MGTEDARREAAAATRKAEGRGFECDEDTEPVERNPAFLITPHGEKVPIPRHVAAQIKSITYNGDQEVRIVTEDEYRAAHADEPHDPHDPEVATMAEEPVEDRLRRAWLNGFKEGVERAAYSSTEAWGRWDS